MILEMSFPGGAAVDATFRSFTVRTDQPEKAGGGGTAAPPFDLFLASIGTCAAYYAMRFCEQRQIDVADLGVTLEPIREPDSKRIDRLRIDQRLPEGFPAKYRRAIERAVDQCAVKRHIVEPPEFELRLLGGESVQ